MTDQKYLVRIGPESGYCVYRIHDVRSYTMKKTPKVYRGRRIFRLDECIESNDGEIPAIKQVETSPEPLCPVMYGRTVTCWCEGEKDLTMCKFLAVGFMKLSANEKLKKLEEKQQKISEQQEVIAEMLDMLIKLKLEEKEKN